MSTESLSANQVANLLKAMETAHWDAGSNVDENQSASTADTGESENGATTGEDDGPPVTAYDFKRPDRVGNDQLQTLWSLHESIAQNFAAAVSRLLRAPLEVKLRSIDQLAYREFVASREKPRCINVITPAPLGGNWVLDVAPALAFAIIDRMLGGDPVPGESIRRPLTEIENRLISRVVCLFLEQIAPAWKNVSSLQPELDSIESTPHRAPIAAPDELVIQVSFEVQWGRNSGAMTLCMPYHTLEPHRDKLADHGRSDRGDRHATDATRRQIAENVDAAKVNVVVTLARSRIKTSDLLGLSVGDIITTEQDIDRPLELAIQDIPKFHATAGAYKGKKAIQIQSMMESQRPSSDDGDA